MYMNSKTEFTCKMRLRFCKMHDWGFHNVEVMLKTNWNYLKYFSIVSCSIKTALTPFRNRSNSTTQYAPSFFYSCNSSCKVRHYSHVKIQQLEHTETNDAEFQCWGVISEDWLKTLLVPTYIDKAIQLGLGITKRRIHKAEAEYNRLC